MKKLSIIFSSAAMGALFIAAVIRCIFRYIKK
jgi:hypothetical protein